MIARNGEGSKIRSQGNTSDRHAITVFHGENSGVQYCKSAWLMIFFFLTIGREEKENC